MTNLEPWPIERWQETLDWQPLASQQYQLQQLYELVIRGNQHQNLTRIIDPLEFWEKHLWDSLRGLKSLDLLTPTALPQRGIDIGTGAGFPGLPIAIAQPHWPLILLDSSHRKIAFVQATTEVLNLPRAQAHCERVETWTRQHRQAYDLVFSRALAAAVVCAEYSLPLLQVGGRALLYRGHWTPEEEQGLQQALAILGGEVAEVDAFTTPVSGSTRHCVVICKTAITPSRFPRPVGMAQHQPLIP
jgi:16S rRNA (guanine527-N7)-methyltransferase